MDQNEETVQQFLDRAQDACKEDLKKLLSSLAVLQKLGSNIIQNPSDVKFRTIKKSNAAIKNKILDVPGLQQVLGMFGFQDKGQNFVLEDTQIQSLFKSLPLIIFRRRLIQARLQSEEAYKEQLQIIKIQRVNARKQAQDALQKEKINKVLEFDKQQRLKMEISYAKSRPIGLATNKDTQISINKDLIFYVNKSSQFNDVILKSKTPIIMDFYADWCGPCKMVMPILERQVKADKGKWHLYKVNTDKPQNALLCQSFKIKGIPHLAVVKNGKVHFSQAGFKDQAGIRLLVEEFIDSE